MDFAAEDRLRDRAYSVWRQLSIEPPIAFADVLPQRGGAKRRRPAFGDLGLSVGEAMPGQASRGDLPQPA